MTTPSWFKREGLALLTDFYQLTMMAGHLRQGRANQEVCFEYVFRRLPPHAGFAIAAGLEPFLNYLENLRFLPDDIQYLRSLKHFDETFLEYLANFRPRLAVRAVPEGTLVFPHEPIVQIEGPVMEAQLVETALLNMLNYQTLIATKAARICLAANGEPVMEFGLRRAHGPDGALSGTRAAYIGGCSTSSNVLAGKTYGIPVAGTHAHSWVMSFESELEAFRAFVELYPEDPILLVDTYDTAESGVPNAIKIFHERRAAGQPVRAAIRLDSGDLAKLSKHAHAMMLEAGFEDPLIVASNDLEEDLIADLKRQGAKINAWGVGTQLITSHDAPALSGVYKLVAVKDRGEWRPRIKISSNLEKATDPAPKSLVRYHEASGAPLGDVLYDRAEKIAETGDIIGHRRIQPQTTSRIRNAAGATRLLQLVHENGERKIPSPSIDAIRNRSLEQVAQIPEEYKRLRNPELYKVLLSPRIAEIKEALLREHER